MFCDGLTKVDEQFRCFGSRENPKTVLLGDSHASSLYPGMVDLYERLDRGIGVLGGGSGCPPLYGVISKDGYGVDSYHCLSFISDTIDLIVKNNNIDEVMLVSRGPLYTTSHGYGHVDWYDNWVLEDAHNDDNKFSNERVFMAGLQRTLERLIQANKRVVYIFDVPELGFDIRTCAYGRNLPMYEKREKCTITFSEYQKRSKPFKLKVLKLIENYPSVHIIDLSEALCDKKLCYGSNGNEFYYEDDDHLSKVGAKFVVNKLKESFFRLYR